jgi:DNA-binding MarR family transcriptional regulator
MSTTATLDELGSNLVTQAARLVRAVRRAVDQPTGVRVLSLLDEHDGLSVTQLAELDRCSQPTMSGTVNALLDNGWVTKQPNPGDARRNDIRLTRTGRDELARFRAEAGHVVAERLRSRGLHQAEDVALAVAVLRDVLSVDNNNTTTTSKGIL